MVTDEALAQVVAALRTMRIASNGHRTAHNAHPVQPTASCNRERLGPQVVVVAVGNTCNDSTCGGHTATHQPQPVQRARSMLGNALAGMGFMRSVGCLASPRVRQGTRRP